MPWDAPQGTPTVLPIPACDRIEPDRLWTLSEAGPTIPTEKGTPMRLRSRPRRLPTSSYDVSPTHFEGRKAPEVDDFELAVATILFLLVLMRLALVTIVGLIIIRPVRDCPACFKATVPVRVHWLDLLSSRFEWRWCPECLWEGPGRKVSPRVSRSAAGPSSQSDLGGDRFRHASG